MKSKKCNFSINNRKISSLYPPYIIAEISANHNGSIDQALKTIQAAKESGVNAIKIQTYTPDTMTINLNKGDFLIKEGLWKNKSLYELYNEAHTPFKWHKKLFDYANTLGVTLFSSPFDESAVDLLESLNCPAYKVASFEITDLPLIQYIAKSKKPMLISTGMASLNEISEAIETAKVNGCDNIAIFHCISSYPALVEESNLKSIQFLKKEFNIEVGLSDHTIGNLASIVATSLGATIIEKHFTLARSNGGVDSSFSIEPEEMKKLVKLTKDAHLALGNNHMRSSNEKANKVFRRSLYFVKNIKKGEIIKPDDIRRIRPGFGMDPKNIHNIIGKKVTKDIYIGDRVTIDCFI